MHERIIVVIHTISMQRRTVFACWWTFCNSIIKVGVVKEPTFWNKRKNSRLKSRELNWTCI